MSGMDWLTGDLLGAGLGAIAGGSSGGGGSSQSTQLDPRMANFVYGADGQSGLLGDAQSIYKQQMAQGGLNDMQRQGIGMQYQYLTSPQYSQGAQSLYDVGAGLLGGGVASNPFNRQQRPQGMQQGAQRPGFQFSPTQASIPTYKPEQRQQIPTGQPQPNQAMGGGSGGQTPQGGSGGGRSAQGSGYTEAGISATLAMLAASQNPMLRALAPTLAAGLGLTGGLGADSQMGGISSALGAMDGIAKTAMPGVGSYLRSDGRVSTVSTPGLLAAADRAMFGGSESSGGPSGGWSPGGFGGISGAAGDPYSY